MARRSSARAGRSASGAGLVTIACPASIQPIVATALPEALTLGLPEEDGHVGPDAAAALEPALDAATVLAIGPGLGRSQAASELVGALLERSNVPLVLDADALFALASHRDWLKRAAGRAVLTPHPGEMARLVDRSADEVDRDRIETARAFAREHGVVLLLKGRPTAIGRPDGEVFLNETGNTGLAKGGSGDVLTGVIAGLLANGASPDDAAALGAYVHGAAADLLAARDPGALDPRRATSSRPCRSLSPRSSDEARRHPRPPRRPPLRRPTATRSSPAPRQSPSRSSRSAPTSPQARRRSGSPGRTRSSGAPWASTHTTQRPLDRAGLARLQTLAAEYRVVAIGEIGLDYYRDLSPRDVQRRVFIEQLALAQERRLPVILHNRDGTEDLLRILGEVKLPAGGVVHSFLGDEALARRFLKLGLYLGIGGPVTYPANDLLRQAVAAVPLDRLVLETDCPYLTPVPHRGKRNEPAYVALVAAGGRPRPRDPSRGDRSPDDGRRFCSVPSRGALGGNEPRRTVAPPEPRPGVSRRRTGRRKRSREGLPGQA